MATTPNYGWTTPNDSDAFRNGASAIRTLGNGVDATLKTALGGNYPGLRLIKSQTVGTGVGSVVVPDAFSAAYDDYKITYTGGAASSGAVHMYMTIGTINSGYFSSGVYQSATSATQTTYNLPSAGVWLPGVGSLFYMKYDIDVSGPFLTTPKTFNSRNANYDNVNSVGGTGWGITVATTSSTYFSLSMATGTMTGGIIRVYGYGKS
jgi:hypothetical protein